MGLMRRLWFQSLLSRAGLLLSIGCCYFLLGSDWRNGLRQFVEGKDGLMLTTVFDTASLVEM